MKKWIGILILLPLWAAAQVPVDGRELSDEEMSQVHASAFPTRCAKFSEFDCYGRAVYQVCMRDPYHGRSGVCTPTDAPDPDGSVSCNCL